MALPPNNVNMNAIYMDMIQVGQTANHATWYDYNSFNNILVAPAIQHSTQTLVHQHQTIHPIQEIITAPAPMQPQPSVLAARPKPPPVVRPKSRPKAVERVYNCEVCGANFSNSSNLKSHSRIHSGERPYACDICGASFVQSSNLKAHKRVHTGERPYMCSECGQRFSRSSHLTGHKRTHTGERPYICGVCQDSFVTSTHLRNHMRKHTGERPYSCSICKLSFAQNAYLQIHLRIHTGERPYKCPECFVGFRSKGDLRSHSKLHTDEKPFRCSRCNRFFKTNQYLQKHIRKCGAPPSGKKRGRPRKIIVEKDPELTLPKNTNQTSSRGKSHTKTRSCRKTKANQDSDRLKLENDTILNERLEEESIEDVIPQETFDEILASDKMPDCDILNDTSCSSKNLSPDIDDLHSDNHNSLLEIEVPSDNFEEIDASSVMDCSVDDVSQLPHISHVEHIEHMPIESMERMDLIKVVHF